MSKKSKKARAMMTRNKTSMSNAKLAAYSIYATGACATVSVGSSMILNNVKMKRREKKKMKKIHDVSTAMTVAGAMTTMAYTMYATTDASDCVVDVRKFLAAEDDDDEDDED